MLLLVFSSPKIIKQEMISIRRLPTRVNAIPKFLRWNHFRSNFICGLACNAGVFLPSDRAERCPREWELRLKRSNRGGRNEMEPENSGPSTDNETVSLLFLFSSNISHYKERASEN